MKKLLSSSRVWVSVITAIAIFTSCASSRKSGSQHAYMNKQYQELKNVLNEADVTLIKDSLKVIFPNNVMYASSSADLKPEIKPAFERFANVLNKYDKTKIMITGHTDNTGNGDFNRELSEKRAAGAKQLLVDDKVDGGRIDTWGQGDRHPIATNNTEEGKAKNRRVEFVILYNVAQQ
ncbi:OmpA family protein [Chitinophaga vietnamensis]|uniref:OmpA family protein n=1 Tax=Chitinophaga vietnamensis TaxID=2593957 RepID=UPI0011778A1A|nr:OmpA family protein [Chitinophaga vietnamensis]